MEANKRAKIRIKKGRGLRVLTHQIPRKEGMHHRKVVENNKENKRE